MSGARVTKARSKSRKRAASATPRPSAESPAASAPRPSNLYTLILLFLLSGATSLVYESLWARQLHLVVGTSQVAISIVLAAFMAGLALGSLAAARYGYFVQRPLLAFAALEGLVAVYALSFDFLIEPATWS
jgi:spermidine synthase